MSTKILTLTKEQQEELYTSGIRWWFLPPRIKTKSTPWVKHANGRKYRNNTRQKVLEQLVFCDTVKVNAKTVILRLPNGDQAKYKLDRVFVTEDLQEKVTEKIMETCTDEVKNLWAENKPFFVNPKIKEEKEDGTGQTAEEDDG